MSNWSNPIDKRGLVARWSLDNDYLDVSGNNHHATPNGGIFPGGGSPSRTLRRKLGGALFDGTGWLSTNHFVTNFSSTGEFTCTARINHAGGGPEIIATDSWISTGNQPAWLFYTEGTAGKLKFYCNDGTGITFTIGTGVAANGQWRDVAVVFNNFALDFYLDGVHDSGSTLSGITGGTFGTSGYGVLIGANNDTSASDYVNFANGAQDDIRLYNRALSAGEIFAISREPFQPRTLIGFETINSLMGGVAALSLTGSQTIPAFTQTATLAALVQINTSQTIPAFVTAETLAALVQAAASQTVPDFTVAETLAHDTALSAIADQTIPGFGSTETLAALIQAAAAQVIPGFGQSATDTVTVTLVAAQDIPAFTQAAALGNRQARSFAFIII